MAEDLSTLTRDELNDYATAEGFQDPARYATKAELLTALRGETSDDLVVPEPDSVSDGDREDVLADFHATGLVRAGFAVNYAWPDVVRKAT